MLTENPRSHSRDKVNIALPNLNLQFFNLLITLAFSQFIPPKIIKPARHTPKNTHKLKTTPIQALQTYIFLFKVLLLKHYNFAQRIMKRQQRPPRQHTKPFLDLSFLAMPRKQPLGG